MNSTCPRCNAVIDPNSRFCTNCGAVLAQQDPYAQSAQPNQAAQLPPWASANPGAAYQQQQWAGQQANAAAGGSLGFGGSNDALAKKVMTWIVAGIAITIGLLILFGMLAAFVPFLRGLFCVLLIVVIIVPLIIYSMVRNYIRRTVGRAWRFF